MLSVSVVNRIGVVAKDEKLRRDQSLLNLFVQIIEQKKNNKRNNNNNFYWKWVTITCVDPDTQEHTQLFALNNNKIIDTIY